MKTLTILASGAAAFLLMPSPSLAQGSLGELATGVPNGLFGRSLANAGDLTGDGIDDLVVGAPQDPSSGTYGSVYVFDGAATGTLVLGPLGIGTLDGCTVTGEPDQFGFSVDGGMDIDGDTVPDLVIGEPGAGNAYALSGANGADILDGTGVNLFSSCGSRHGFQVRLLNADGDGAADVLVIDRSELIGSSIRFRIYNGAWIASGGTTGNKVLFTRTSTGTGDGYGRGVAVLGDIDGDGRDEFAIGAIGSASGLIGGYVEVWSSGTATMLTRLDDPDGSSQQERFGSSVASAGDFDGDGIPDVLIGAPAWNAGSTSAVEGRLEVVSGAWIRSGGATARTLALVEGSGDERLGSTVQSADLNNDGRPDVIAAFEFSVGGHGVRTISGRTGLVMYEDAFPQGNIDDGIALLPDGAGITNVAIGFPNDSEVGPNAGKVVLRRGLDSAGVLETPGMGCLCVDAAPAGCENSTGRGGLLAAEGGTVGLTGGSLTLTGTGMSRSQPAIAFCGLPGPAVLPSGNGLFGLAASQRVGIGKTDANGTIALTGDALGSYQTLTFSSLSPGTTVRFQLVYRDLNCAFPTQGSINWTNAYEVIVR
jgi:hypothetical protein